MSHVTSAVVATVLALCVFAGMQAFRSTLGSSRPLTVAGGFLGSNMFVFLLTAVSNAEMEFLGGNFQAKLIPEVVGCLLMAVFASSLVHRVCVTTCILFSVGFLYFMNKISASRYNLPVAPVALASKKKK